ncbi:10590_t:CDS:2 [Ambispora gerdemannii]|uniref:10590_t:CDS:1 n=1 Tax=Ambispora gerdemannii TaxID=144530 RepID=A0A9N9E137_9GLOM|nr:10590_t:CDS:2 [Ambispora gerdemannii]
MENECLRKQIHIHQPINGTINGINGAVINSEALHGEVFDQKRTNKKEALEQIHQIIQGLRGQKQSKSISIDSDSDEELTDTLEQDTLGYDGLALLFNDSNEDVIMGKIDENTLEEENKLPLASDTKANFNVGIYVHTVYLVGISSSQ